MLMLDKGKCDQKLRRVSVTLFAYKKQNVKSLIGVSLGNSALKNMILSLMHHLKEPLGVFWWYGIHQCLKVA
jgi:hypothetical protein